MWLLIRNQREYKRACRRFEELKNAKRGKDHREKMLLAFILNHYEKEKCTLPDVDPIALIRIRMEQTGIKSVDIARTYGDHGTVSKILNYKQKLPLSLIRICSRMLRIPADALIKDYSLQKT